MAPIRIKLPEEEVKFSVKIKKTLSNLLDDYTGYLSEVHNRKILKDTVVESLIETLYKDKDFVKSKKSGKKTKKGKEQVQTDGNS